MSAKPKLHGGIPMLAEYQKFVTSSDFKDIEAYSNQFISQVGGDITSYNNRWVPDPLHQWSRQWEYPFIIYSIKNLHRKGLKILDLGAGMTFLPYYLKDKLSADTVKALDYDQSLGSLYGRVNKARKTDIDFSWQDIRELSKASQEQYDVIYSVSVLEHTDQYADIIKSCYKLLKPGGIFCLTFDISLDRHGEISLAGARKLLKSISKTFQTGDLTNYLKSNFTDVVTSSQIAKLDKKLMPWKYPLLNVIKPIIGLKGIGKPYKRLTFCCVSVRKAR